MTPPAFDAGGALADARTRILPGAAEYDHGRYFEAHEVWEDAWRPLPRGDERTFLQGLIHLAVALEHHRRGNPRGARGQREKAGVKLAFEGGNPGVDVGATLAGADAVLAGAAAAPHPRVIWCAQRAEGLPEPS
jgi:hypothetical protein